MSHSRGFRVEGNTMLAAKLIFLRKEGDHMGRNKRLSSMTIPELIEKEGTIIEDLKIKNQELRILENKRKKLTVREMTRRLCDHGRLLERYFPPDDFTDEQIDMILFGLLRNPSNQKAIEILKAGGHIRW